MRCLTKTYSPNQQAAHAADSHESRKSECFTRFVSRPNWFVVSKTEGNDVAAATAPNWNAERAFPAQLQQVLVLSFFAATSIDQQRANLVEAIRLVIKINLFSKCEQED